MSKINETNYPRRTQANYEDTDMLVIQEAGGNTYTTRIEDLREDCQETLAPALNTMRENLATVEGSTASKAYAKGDFLVFGGRLCKAKTSIALGATLVLDTNIELDSVGDELTSLSSHLTDIDTKIPTFAYKYHGKYYGTASGSQTINFPVDAGVFLVTVTSYGVDTGGLYIVSVGTTQIKIAPILAAPNTTLSASGRTLTYSVPAYNEITFVWLAAY